MAKKSEDSSQPHARVALRVFCDRHSPSEISLALEVQPTSCHRKGEPVSSRNPSGPKREHNIWIYSFSANLNSRGEISLRNGRALFTIEVERRLARLPRCCEVDVRLGIFMANGMEALVIPRKLSDLVAAIKGEIMLDLYGPD